MFDLPNLPPAAELILKSVLLFPFLRNYDFSSAFRSQCATAGAVVLCVRERELDKREKS